MTTSEQTDRIAEALAKAQAEMDNAPLNKTNPHFRSRYADLAGIRNATVPYLAKHGIAVVQPFGVIEGVPVVFTRLVHGSGQWMQGYCALPAVADMQKFGSAVTYARRYSLSAMCGIAADEDDDGNDASQDSHEKNLSARPLPLYEDAWTDLCAASVEGIDAFDKAWEAMPVAVKNYVTANKRQPWNDLRKKAHEVTKAAAKK